MTPSQIVLLAALLAPAAAFAQPVAPDPSFSIRNEGGGPITAFFATPAGRPNWGQDRLNGRGLAVGAVAEVRLPRDGNCIYDLRAVFSGGRTEDRRDVNTCKLKHVAVLPPVAKPQGFQLLNEAPSPIVELAARPAGTARWEVNHLPGGPVAPGQARQIALPPRGGCVFDLRVRFADGATREKHATDLCRTPSQIIR
jgi:hypothetical protein